MSVPPASCARMQVSGGKDTGEESRVIGDIVLVAFDLETTGFRVNEDEILQIGACTSSLKTIVESSQDNSRATSFDVLIAVQGQLPGVITELTGITCDMVATSGRPLADGIQMFFEYLRTQVIANPNQPIVLCSWNGNNFDIPFLNVACKRLGMSLEGELSRVGVHCHVDMLPFARKYVPPTRVPHPIQRGKSQYTLGNVHYCLTGRPIQNSHTATADARAVLSIVQHMQEHHGHLILAIVIEERHGRNFKAPHDDKSRDPIIIHSEGDATTPEKCAMDRRNCLARDRQIAMKPRKRRRYSPLALC